MGIEPTAGGCPATGFEVQERHQAANYSRMKKFFTNRLHDMISNCQSKLNFHCTLIYLTIFTIKLTPVLTL